MRHNFIEYNQDQQHLPPKDISDWVEEDSLERFISDAIDYLDTEEDWTPSIQNLGRTAARGRPSTPS